MSVKDAVGSSRISTRASAASALATETIVCWTGVRSAPSLPTGIGWFSRSSSSLARRRMVAQRTRPPRLGVCSPSRMFSATSMVGIVDSSWYSATTPARPAARTLANSTVPPSRRISPASGAWMPVSTLMSVDLPAPFSPRSAWISPERTESRAPSRACTPSKRFTMSTASSAATG